jgi:hypothetical protein
MTDQNIPQTWLQKVQYYLERDPRVKDQANNSPVVHPKGKSYGQLVWDVTIAIQKSGNNPSAYSKAQIVEAAHAYLDGGAVPATPIAQPAAKAAVKPEVKAAVSEAVSEALSNEGESQMKLNLPIRLSITTLLCSALELTRLDKAADAAALRAELDKVVKLYYKGLRRAETET